MNNDLDRIKTIMELARTDINRQKADRALETLKGIAGEIGQHEGTCERAEYSLLLGEAFCAKRTEGAEPHLKEALELIAKLPARNLELERRVHECLGNFYSRVLRRFTKARDHYGQAKSVAVQLGVREVTARIELRIIVTDLEIDQDPQLRDFQILKRIAEIKEYTSDKQLAVWHLHLGESASLTRSLRFARNYQAPSERYFEDLLQSIE